MQLQFPHRPVKGQAFTLYFGMFHIVATVIQVQNVGTWTYCGISKDGGAFVAVTNAPVEITSDTADGQSGASSRARYSIALTATEMNADAIILTFADGATATWSIVIYTATAELAAAPTLNSPIHDKITAIFQYLFNRRTVTATQEKVYKNDGTTVLATGTLSDNGTTFDKGAPV